MASGFPGQFQGGYTTGYLNIGAVQKQVTGAAAFPGAFQGGYTTGYLCIGAVQRTTVAGDVTVIPSTVTVTITGYAPKLNYTINAASPTALTITGQAPKLITALNTAAPTALTITSYAPTVIASDNKTLVPAKATLTITGYAPTVIAGGGTTVIPGKATLSITGHAIKLDNVIKLPGSGAALGNTVTYLGTDTDTKGDWVDVYGEDGFYVVGEAAQYPDYAAVTLWNVSEYGGWTVTSNALQKPSNPTQRWPNCKYGFGINQDIEITIDSGLIAEVGIYFWDGDDSSRKETIAVLNGDTDAVIDAAREFGPGCYSNPIYIRYRITGHVKLRFNPTGGSYGNATYNGIFFDNMREAVTALTFTGYAPIIKQTTVIQPAIDTLTITSYAPTVIATDNKTVQPGVDTLTITSYAPTVLAGDNKTVTPAIDTLNITSYAPIIITNQAKVVDVPRAQLTITGYKPTIKVSNNQYIVPDIAQTLTITGFAPSVSISTNVKPNTTALTITSYIPTVVTTAHVTAVPISTSLYIVGYPIVVLGATSPLVEDLYYYKSYLGIYTPLESLTRLTAISATYTSDDQLDYFRNYLGRVG